MRGKKRETERERFKEIKRERGEVGKRRMDAAILSVGIEGEKKMERKSDRFCVCLFLYFDCPEVKK